MTFGDAIWRIFLCLVGFAVWVFLGILWVGLVGWLAHLIEFDIYNLGGWTVPFWIANVLAYHWALFAAIVHIYIAYEDEVQARKWRRQDGRL